MAKQAKSKAEPKVSEGITTVPFSGVSELKAAWALFDAGDNRGARKIAKALLATGTAAPEAQAEARDLLARIGYDPGAALSVAGITAAVTLILTLLTVFHKLG
jgi:hypothetical protein